jgi:hypothetical protein
MFTLRLSVLVGVVVAVQDITLTAKVALVVAAEREQLEI